MKQVISEVFNMDCIKFMKPRPDLNTLSKEVAISVKQPWAYLLCANIKPIENRTWKLPEKHKGKRVYIHASGIRENVVKCLSEEQKDVVKSLDKWKDIVFPETSSIIGYVEFSECIINHPSIWAEKSPIEVVFGKEFLVGKPIYNWVVANAVLFDKPILNVKGKLSFWDCSNIIHSELDEDGKHVCMCNLGIDEKDQVISYGDHFRCKYCDGKWYK